MSGAAAAWWGCSAAPAGSSNGGGGSQTTSSGGGGTTMSTGGVEIETDGGTDADAEVCVSTSATAERVQLDIVFLIDRSQSMAEGMKWVGTTTALNTFFNDPASAKIGAGMTFFPNDNELPCVPTDYEVLTVPIAPLPANAFLLTNAFPAIANGGSTPTYGALKGALTAATAYQDAHPKHKVIVVLATDGGPNSCGAKTMDDIANLAKSARNYNGVLTYVIAVSGSDVASINKIAVAGGTVATYDITNDINEFSAKVADIRSTALGCDFDIPEPPNGQELDSTQVNFSYTPEGMGAPKILLRADNILDCNGMPGWYFDNNTAPTKIILCPASCATVQADANAKVEALFGCKSQVN
jgi:hypothetical protein